MDQSANHCLSNTITKEIIDLSITNAQLYSLMNKISNIGAEQDKIGNLRLQEIHQDVKQKIRTLAYNIDLLYQNIDAKISIIVSQLRSPPSPQLNSIKNRFQSIQNKNRDLQENISKLKIRNDALMRENDHLKQTNIQLFKELQQRRKERRDEPTYDDSKLSTPTIEASEDINNLSSFTLRNLTFQSPKRQVKVNLLGNKLIEEQSSFSQMLIKQQNCSLEKQKSRQNNPKTTQQLAFGCMPRKTSILSKKGRQSIVKESGVFEQKNEHRINFLLESLKEKSYSFSKEKSLRRNHSEGKHIFMNRLVQYSQI